MSGFEIAGIILGVIPVVLEGYKQYQKFSEACSRFRTRSRSRELCRLDTIINTQKTIFRRNATKILVAITEDAERSRDLLSGELTWDHLGVSEIAVANAEVLKETFACWIATANEIKTSLETICSIVEGFRLSSSIDSTEELNKDAFSRLRKQFAQCFRQDEVQTALENLRYFSSDFDQLTKGILDDLGMPQQKRPSQNLESARLKSSYWNSLTVVAPFEAADGAPLWLEIECLEAIMPSKMQDSPKLLPLPLPLPLPAAQKGDAAWVASLQLIQKHSQPLTLSAPRVPNRLTKKPRTSLDCGSTAPVKTVRFENLSVNKTAGSSSSVSRTETTSKPIRPEDDSKAISPTNLDIVEDVCQHLQMAHSECNSTCVGYIQHVGLHRFYIQAPRSCVEHLTLAEIIAWVSEDEFSRDPLESDIAHVASSLAQSVLQFHTTPWLPESWQSDHVRFFGVSNPQSGLRSLSSISPYFRVEFNRADKKEKGKAKEVLPLLPARQNSERNDVRSEVLFSLGLVLLELGFCRPWPLLRSSKLTKDVRSDYHAAEKLAKSPMLRNKMGHKYAKITRKCLGCDFGLGENDFQNKELQGVFLVDVVNSLQELERNIKEFEIEKLGRGRE